MFQLWLLPVNFSLFRTTQTSVYLQSVTSSHKTIAHAGGEMWMFGSVSR